ncbi:MAG: 50S ribosomal protein L15 [Alphaproteobacteria bacterium]|nr:50S ribosomal protein L15 [Alphaproteobacteria bacterium]
MKLNEIRDNPGARTKKVRVGRGIGSGLGKTSGKGGKGQTARSGVALNGFEGGQTPLYRRMPKRGFRNTAFQRDFVELNLGDLQKAIDDKRVATGATVTSKSLVEAGVIRRALDGVRLLGDGADAFKAAVTIEVAGASKSAVAAVEKAGGKVMFLALEREGAVKANAARREKRQKKLAAAAKPAGGKAAAKAEG